MSPSFIRLSVRSLRPVISFALCRSLEHLIELLVCRKFWLGMARRANALEMLRTLSQARQWVEWRELLFIHTKFCSLLLPARERAFYLRQRARDFSQNFFSWAVQTRDQFNIKVVVALRCWVNETFQAGVWHIPLCRRDSLAPILIASITRSWSDLSAHLRATWFDFRVINLLDLRWGLIHVYLISEVLSTCDSSSSSRLRALFSSRSSFAWKREPTKSMFHVLHKQTCFRTILIVLQYLKKAKKKTYGKPLHCLFVWLTKCPVPVYFMWLRSVNGC